MRNTSTSFAHQYGITQKNLTQSSSNGLGLNPNLNIQDEYIENLLKQTHFLNMQIKLIKQKQKQNKGMGIMGILNKDQNPVVTHAVTSNAKYSSMKNQLAVKVNNAQAQSLKLDDENFAVKAQRDQVQKLSLKQQQKNIENKMYVDKQLKENIDKLKQNQKKLNQIRQENSRVKDNFIRINKDWQQITNKEDTKHLMKKINSKLQEQIEELRQNHFANTKASLQANQKILKQDDEKNRSDPQYIQLVQQNKQLLQKLKLSQKQLFELNYQVKQKQQLKKLSIRNKDSQAQQKKQSIDQCQKLKKKLADRKIQFQTKLKDSKASLQSNEQIRMYKGKVARKDKQIADLKKKTQISENNFKRLRDQCEKLGQQVEKKKAINVQKQEKQKKISAVKNTSVEQLNRVQQELQNAQTQKNGIVASLKLKRAQLQSLQEQSVYLKAKQQYLTKQVDVDEGLKGVKIEQLMGLMQNNSGLNNTIKDLMEKWEQIKKFTSCPPEL